MRKASIGALAIVAAALPAAVAGAGQQFDSKVTIEAEAEPAAHAPNLWRFSGKVKSEKDACTRDRNVVLYREKAGGDPHRVGGDSSNSNGAWKVRHVDIQQAADFFAKVKPEDVDAGTCKGDRSKRLAFA